ncbi:MAG: hypothetical protein HY815_12170 [Candidatus Riflebacteria bacterium]|nr:hypothetical protein [Candidatus Riflebacteria bacterium]
MALKAVFRTEPEVRRRFAREGAVLARLSPPNVVKVYKVETIGQTTVLVLELVEGRTLQTDLTAPGGTRPERR